MNTRHSLMLSLVIVSIGCEKPNAGAAPEGSAKAPAESTVSAQPTSASSSSVAAAPAEAPSAVASTAAAAPSAASAHAAAAPASAGASGSVAAASASAAPSVALKAASTHIDGRNFGLDVSTAGCRADSVCSVTLSLSPTGDYHVNKEYPYKFTGTPAGGVTFLGNGDANTFSRASGDFREATEKLGVLTVRFRAPAGDAKISGTYKMSVCSAANCEMVSQAVSLTVPVM